MPKCKLTDTNQYPLKGTDKRVWHIATVHRGSREFLLYVDLLPPNFYLEEITGGTVQKISDESLFFELDKFLEEHNLKGEKVLAWVHTAREKLGFSKLAAQAKREMLQAHKKFLKEQGVSDIRELPSDKPEGEGNCV